MTQATPPTLPASIGSTSAGGTAKKSEPREDFSGTFRVQLEGKVQEPAADSASTLTVQAGQEQVAKAVRAASATLAGTRQATAAPKLMQPFATSHEIIATEAPADHAPQGVFTEATGVPALSVVAPGLQPSGVVVAAVAAPTHILRPTRKSSGTMSPIGASGVGANQAGAVAPTVGQVGAGAVQTDVPSDKGSSRQNFAHPSVSSMPAPTQAPPVARVATGPSSGATSPIGVSGVGANQVSAVAPEVMQSDAAPDTGLSRHNLVPTSESSIPVPTQAAPSARAATGPSSDTANSIRVSSDGENQVGVNAPAAGRVGAGAVQSDAAPDTELSRHNSVRTSESSIPASTQVAPSARPATGPSSGTASPIGVSGVGANQDSAAAPGAVQSDAAPDTGLSRHNLVRTSESSIPVPTQAAPPARAATGPSSGTASPIRVSGGGENQASAIVPAAGQVGAGAVQSDFAPDKELSLQNLARRTETSIPSPAQSAVEVMPAVASTATEVQRNLQSPSLPFAVDTPLSNPGWGSAMAARLVWGATQGMQSASIEINPRDLGPVSVNLNVVGEETSITFVSQHALVRDALEAALPRLRELFSGEGLNLGEVDISSGEGRSNSNNDATPADDMQSNGQADAQPDPAVTSSSDEARAHQHDSLVDTFA